MIPNLFDIDHTLDRKVESWQKVTNRTQNNQLNSVIRALERFPEGLSSRMVANITEIERTSVTRVFATNKKLFDVSEEMIDSMTGKRVTKYKLKLDNKKERGM